ncbi:hypothetical protein MJO28_000323 [Puccinia striiformis f. sp. tritici]|uniref:Uncharacterized protein n=1 Tax=Puccinia striiformis f. sp. tritici TaxID=168172 RepID=A0ACC0EYT8_9BASI|nr:hypothetical protein MJO28_000323 [Puccinia striiformis f. sp. tritici]KAI7967625.1 hypothetical protein MJO29_000902 [Puccinia striiformis f. sp. tritici]KAI9601748.1 hypothetical protein KEM48_000852 [Puccinia striiformis f. sp. tritici PST-130]
MVCSIDYNSIIQGAADPLEHLSESARREVWQQGDLVIQGFEGIAAKLWDLHYRERRPTIESIEGDDPIKAYMGQLRSSVLPLLLHQCSILTRLLNTSDLLKEPGSALKLILAVQPEIERAVDQISPLFFVNCGETKILASNKSDDQHHKEFKMYRVEALRNWIEAPCFRHLVHAVAETSSLIKQLQLSTERPPYESEIYEIRHYFLDYSTHIETKDMMLCFEGSELDVVQIKWPQQLEKMESTLQNLLTLANSPNNAEGENAKPQAEALVSDRLGSPVVVLARSAITITKLCRLFFKQLSRRGMNKRRLPLCTGMHSYQLQTLGDSVDDVHKSITNIKLSIEQAETTYKHVIIDQLTREAENLSTRLSSCLVLILLHFVPLIPETDGFPSRTYFVTWFATWQDQFYKAKQTFITAIEYYDNNTP